MPAETVLPIDPCVDQLSRWSPLLRVDDVASELLALLEQVPDPRDRRGRRYRLPSLLVLALSAVAAGARSFYAIADWVSCASAEVLARVGIRFRVPSESTIRLTLGCLDGDELDRVLGGYLSKTRHQEDERVAVAIDGKTVRGARTADALAPHLVAAVTHDGTTVLGQRRIDSKSNEIPAVRTLLKGLDVAGGVISVDAMHTQKATARLLCTTCGADYRLTELTVGCSQVNRGVSRSGVARYRC